MNIFIQLRDSWQQYPHWLLLHRLTETSQPLRPPPNIHSLSSVLPKGTTTDRDGEGFDLPTFCFHSKTCSTSEETVALRQNSKECAKFHCCAQFDYIIAASESFSPQLQINTHTHARVCCIAKTSSRLNGTRFYAGRLKGTNGREGQRRLKESLRTSDDSAPSPAPPPAACSRTSLETAPSNYLIVGQLLNNVRGWLPSSGVSAARGYNVPVNIRCLSR